MPGKQYRTFGVWTSVLTLALAAFLMITSCDTPNMVPVDDPDGTFEITKADTSKGTVRINVLLNTALSDEILRELGTYGKIAETIEALNAVTLSAKGSVINDIAGLPYVASVNRDAERQGGPIDTVAAEDFADGLSTWNLDAVNVTDIGFDNRQVEYDGTGVYVAVLDTGLVNT